MYSRVVTYSVNTIEVHNIFMKTLEVEVTHAGETPITLAAGSAAASDKARAFNMHRRAARRDAAKYNIACTLHKIINESGDL